MNPDRLTVDWHLCRICNMIEYLNKDRDEPWVLEQILRRIDAMGYTDLQRAALYGLIAAFTGVNNEAQTAAEKWTLEYTDKET
jgi:hypothetical protein